MSPKLPIVYNNLMHVSVLVINYDGQEDTLDCLKLLQKIKHPNFTFSVIVFDNGSKEPFVPQTRFQPENTTVLRSDANLGFTNGNNSAYKYAVEHDNPDYILLLNNDTVVDPNFLVELLACATQNEKVGLVTPKIYFYPGREYHQDSYTKAEKGKVLWYAGGSIDWKNLDAFHRGVDELDRGQFDNQATSDFGTGCTILIPKTVIDQVGFFAEDYFVYLEDVDLCQRMQLAGYPIYFCPHSVVWHKNAGSSGGAGSPLHQYYQTRNRLYFFIRYGSWRTKLTTISFAFRLLMSGSNYERKGVIDWLIGAMGKQAVM